MTLKSRFFFGLLLLSTIICFGQTKTNVTSDNSAGLAPGQTFGGYAEDIDYSTGGLRKEITLLSLPGRHGANLNVTLSYNSKPPGSLSGTWDENQGSATYLVGSPTPLVGLPGGWQLNIPVLQTNIHTTLNSSGPVNNACYQNFIVTTADGSSHTFPNQADCATTMKNFPFTVTPAGDSPLGSAYDLPVLLLDSSNTADIVLRGKDGTSTHFFTNLTLAAADPSGADGPPVYKMADSIVDANGNTISITTTNGNIVLTDSLGRTVTLTYGNPSPQYPNGMLTSVSYLDSSGVQRTINLGYSNITLNYTFSSPAAPQAANAPITISGTGPALSSITFLNGRSYSLEYNTTFGELKKITYPTGGYTRYDFATYTHYWQAADIPDADAATPADYREISARHICRDPQGSCTTSTEDTTTYTPTIDGTMTNNQYMDVTDALGNRTHYQFSVKAFSGTSLSKVQSASDPFFARELYRYIYSGASTLMRTIQTEYNNLDGNGSPTAMSVPMRVTTTLNDSSQVSKAEYDYDSDVYDNVIAERDFDYGNGTPGPLVRRTAITWLKTNSVNNVNYLSSGVHILNRKLTDAVYDNTLDKCQGQNRACAKTVYEYDNYTVAITASGAVQHDAGYGTSYTVRGNITSVQAYRNSDGAMLTTRNQYDDAGNVVSVTDPALNKTTMSYTDSWDNSTCAPASGSTAAYLTGTTNAKNQTSSGKFNSCSGTMASVTDVNGQTTTFSYDAMGRLTQTKLPADSSGNHPQTTITFNEASLPLSITTSKVITSSANLASTVTLDGLGRVTQTSLDSDPAGHIVDITYDALGRKATESNPHTTATGGATDGVTNFSYDALGRTIQVKHPDGTFVTTSYNGSATEVTDEGNGGKTVERISQTDGLGRMVSVCEVSSGPFVAGGGISAPSMIGTGGTPAACGQIITATGFLTTYTYDILGNLIGVSQGGAMQRSFTYDSLSHLLTSSNPESGTTTYTYDADGNVATKTDARNITTTYTYDALNRLAGKSYATGNTPDPLTPTVTLTYDACPTGGCPTGMSTQFQTGRLVAISNSFATTFNSYDKWGRLAGQWECTPVNCSTGNFNLLYTYDLGGDLLTETNGFGVKLTYGYDAVDRLQSLSSSLSDAAHPGTLLSNVQYGPLGMTSQTLGNGVTEAVSYTNRGQLQNLSVGGIIVINHPATPGSGSATLAGSERSATAPLTAATGSVSIYGFEQSECSEYDDFGNCISYLYDHGSVSITVGGFTATSSYTQFSNNTSDSIAGDLTNKLNGSSSPVTATLSGTTINLTSKATGSGANLSLTTSNTSIDSMNSFTGITSGFSLTGGGGGQTVYDAGTVTVTVNGTPYSVSYGQGSTTSSIANAVASALTAGTLVNGTASGSTVNITAKTAGASTNYSLSVSSATSNPQGLFSGPSFTISASGSALTGGANAYTTTQGATIYSLTMGYAPNGNVTSANDSANGNWTYSYDDFNRLVGSNKNTGQQTYNYVYDRFGNRWQQNAPQGGNTEVLTFSAGGNNRMDSYSYDAAGNLLSDGANTFTYDGESRIVKSVNSGVTTTYVYDGLGQRVRKVVAGVSTDYVHNSAGQAVAEVNSSGAWTRGEVFAGGRHLATYAGGASGAIYFNHADWLGTERLRSDLTGAACETITGLIFGDGMAVSGGCGDPSTRHFTGKEHDTETGLDDFGARYYSAQMGRFVTADWSAVPAPVPYANLNNPQTLNLYALVHENPATFADLDGHLAPGQLGFSEGMGITPRMRGGNGSAYGCATTGCETQVTIWAVRLPSGVEFFESEALAKATVAEYKAKQAQDYSGHTIGPFSWYTGTPTSETEEKAVKAHEAQHRADFWNGNDFSMSCGELELRGFQAEIQIYHQRITELRSKHSLSEADKKELQADGTALSVAKTQTKEVLEKVYCGHDANWEKQQQVKEEFNRAAPWFPY